MLHRSSPKRRELRSWVCIHRWTIFTLLLLVPAVGIFCWQSDSSTPKSSFPPAIGPGEPELAPARPFNTEEYLAETLRPVPNPRFVESSRQARNPFPSGMSREMIAAQGDPFLFAYLSGDREGELLRTEQRGGIITLGPALPRTVRSRENHQDLLRLIDHGVGGSMNSFLSNVLTPARSGERAVSAEAIQEDENPFLKALEANVSSPPEEKIAAKPVEPPAPPAPAKDETPPPVPATETTPAKASIGGSGPVTTLRPYTLLRVEGGASLRTVAVSRPRENVLESAELGIRDFSVFSFMDPAEYPMTMAAADFNGDGFADLAVHIPGSGAIRIYSGSAEGKFSEQVRIQASRFPSSLVSADFDRDGAADLAISGVGTGLVTILYGDGGRSFDRYRVYWSETYRDYIAALENPATGSLELAGMTFPQRGQALIDFSAPEGRLIDRPIEYTPAHSSEISTFKGRSARLQGVLLNSRLSVNVDNRAGQMTNVMNVAAGVDVYVVIGDLSVGGSVDVGLAIPLR